jgi:hypothetical protein
MAGQLSFFQFAFAICVASCIPMCGYYGARDRSPHLLHYFAAGNGFCALVQIGSLFFAFATLGYQETTCRDCLTGDQDFRNKTRWCDYYVENVAKKENCNLTGLYMLEIISFLILFSLYVFSARIAYKLASRPVFVQHIRGGNQAVNVSSWHQQPGTVVQARVVSMDGVVQPPVHVYQNQPQVVMSSQQPIRAGPSAVYQAHASVPQQQKV